MGTPKLEEALSRADLVHDSPVLRAAIERIGGEIDALLAGSPAVFLTVMQGALAFAGPLATSIRAPLSFDYVHATRYRGATSGGELLWIKQPAISLAGATVLLVDDILDEGHTLKAVRDWCEDQGAAEVRIAVLCVKNHERRVEGIDADYIALEVPDAYVYGYGMDYHEQGRNLPGIYALEH